MPERVGWSEPIAPAYRVMPWVCEGREARSLDRLIIGSSILLEMATPREARHSPIGLGETQWVDESECNTAVLEIIGKRQGQGARDGRAVNPMQKKGGGGPWGG